MNKESKANKLFDEIMLEVRKLDSSDLHRLYKELGYLKTRGFKVGSRICFSSNKKPYEISGIITKINTKTFSMVTDDHQKWRVSKSLVKLVEGK